MIISNIDFPEYLSSLQLLQQPHFLQKSARVDLKLSQTIGYVNAAKSYCYFEKKNNCFLAMNNNKKVIIKSCYRTPSCDLKPW